MDKDILESILEFVNDDTTPSDEARWLRKVADEIIRLRAQVAELQTRVWNAETRGWDVGEPLAFWDVGDK